MSLNRANMLVDTNSPKLARADINDMFADIGYSTSGSVSPITTTGEASKLFKFSTIANTILHFFRIRKSSTTALSVQDDSSIDVLNVDSTNKIVTSYNQKVTGLAGTGSRTVVAGDDGRLGTTGVDFIFSNISLTSTPVSTGININGYSNGKIIMAYLSGQWDAGNVTSAALIMIRCGYDGDNFSATVISSDNYVFPVTFSQINGTLHVATAFRHGVRIRFITN